MTDSTEILELVLKIKPMLAGHTSEVQGAVLADLVSMWMIGHPPPVRNDMVSLHVHWVLKLIPLNERLLRVEH